MTRVQATSWAIAVGVALIAQSARAQGAWETAHRCAVLNSDPQYRPLLNEQVRENPPITLTVGGGFAMANSTVGQHTGPSGGTNTGWGRSTGSLGLGGTAVGEVELGAFTPFWARANVQLIAAGRTGLMGEAAVGFTLRSYGVYFVPAGASVSYSRYYVSVSTWNNHCSLRRFDFRGFAGLRWGGVFGRNYEDDMGNLTRTVDGFGWIAPQLGITTRVRFAGGRGNDTTLAGMIDVTHMSGGAYIRTYGTFGPVFFGVDFGFFLPFDRTNPNGFSMWWSTLNLGINWEV